MWKGKNNKYIFIQTYKSLWKKFRFNENLAIIFLSQEFTSLNYSHFRVCVCWWSNGCSNICSLNNPSHFKCDCYSTNWIWNLKLDGWSWITVSILTTAEVHSMIVILLVLSYALFHPHFVSNQTYIVSSPWVVAKRKTYKITVIRYKNNRKFFVTLWHCIRRNKTKSIPSFHSVQKGLYSFHVLLLARKSFLTPKSIELLQFLHYFQYCTFNIEVFNKNSCRSPFRFQLLPPSNSIPSFHNQISILFFG